ncbi:uncharacterized protein [Nicotiana tomentosiformis]|uniref:uncharacterized protein n=1 Tax=Nicotiana tomentosiformis TaxID=4098 RepID=UPI00388C7DC2
MRDFEQLKPKLTTTPILTSPNWSFPFELMCDASDMAVGAVLGKCINKGFHPVYYASKTMNSSHVNYTIKEKDLLAIVFAIEKFRPYLIGAKFIVHTDHVEVPRFADLANFLVSGIISEEFTSNQRKKIKRDCKDYYWDEPYLFRICTDGVNKRCVPEEEHSDILGACHSSPYGGHHGGARTTAKVLSCGFYWPNLYIDATELVGRCDESQRAGGTSKKHEMPFTTILEIDIFDVWSIDFMGPFVSFYGNTYMLVMVDYVSKWVEAVSLPNNEARSVVTFLKKNTFTRFGQLPIIHKQVVKWKFPTER